MVCIIINIKNLKRIITTDRSFYTQSIQKEHVYYEFFFLLTFKINKIFQNTIKKEIILKMKKSKKT